ncbi:MAG: dihydrodipicolinate synthase family protein [Hyphomicrobiaceae bacterium]
MPTKRDQVLSGVLPIAPTPFHDNGDLDPEGMRRVLDCMIDQGVDGICILANYSEQFLLSDAERQTLLELSTSHVAGRVPVIATISHFSTRIVAERARKAAEAGATMVMMMPPYHGAGLRAGDDGMIEHFREAAKVGGLPIMLQDAPLSGVPLSVPFLVRLGKEVPAVRYFKIEMPGTAQKLRALIAAAGHMIDGPFDGEEGITLMADLDAGATGTMTSAMYPDLIKPVLTAHLAGRRTEALGRYTELLPLINYENRQTGLRGTKTIMKEGGVIRSDAVRHPLEALDAATKAGLLELARQVNPLALRWGR